MRNKIGIITLTDMYNYGNSLQNYAVQQIINKLGFISETLFVSFGGIKILAIIKSIIKGSYYHKKILSFKHFNKRNLTIRYRNHFNVNTNSQYDAFVVGSDQVWNTSWYDTFPFMKEVYLLCFADNNKKISFAASFGIDVVKSNYNEFFSSQLLKFKALSVREEAGSEIIKELTGKDAEVLVDPTMLLDREEWQKIYKKPKHAKEGYILTYFLSPKCNEAKVKLEDIKGNKEVYELLNPDDKVAGSAGPSEFLWLFDHADIILTDSFHACVFSFLFNKPFIVYDRNWDGGNMNSRLETLLSKFSLERKYANSGIENDIWEHDYTEGYKQLEIERKKAIDFLKKALED